MFNLLKKLKNKALQKGIALMMVLAGITILSGVVVEFAYNSNVTYNLALNELDRVQAYYLAQSGYNFSKLLLKFDKETRKIANQASKKSGKTIIIPPLYEVIPLDTAMIRGLSGLAALPEEEAPPAELPTEGEEEVSGLDQPSALEQGLSLIDSKGAEEFLAFKGDFSVQIYEEDSKINLNSFFKLGPKEKSYDQLKSLLYHLLAHEDFSEFFSDRYRGAKELAQNIVDYIDKDEVHNEPGGQERGREGIQGGLTGVMKNGKLLSIEELILVPGMNDDILKKLREYVTVYGSDEKINICRAGDPLVQAMIIAYTENNPRMAPLKDDNEELLSRATEAVMNNCPDSAAMSRELDKALGVAEAPQKTSSRTTTASRAGPTTTQQQQGQNTSFQSFGDLIKKDSGIFTIISTGTVGNSEVKLTAVLNIAQGNPQQWKEMYWKVE